MAHDEETSGGMSHETGQNPLTLGLSFIAGGGVTLMIVALAIGVADPAQESLVWLLFLVGLAMMIGGIVAWLGVVRPHENFDDIDQPLYDGHDHDDDHDDHDEHALAVREDSSVTAAH